MRKTLLWMGLVVSGILLLSGALNSVQAAALPSGDICWTITQTQTEKGSSSQSFTLKMHLVASDTTIGTACGLVSVSGDNPSIISGTYFKSGSYIYMNLVMTQKHTDSERECGILQAKVSASSLGGTFFMIRNDFDTSAKTFEDGYSSGTLVKTTCK